MRPPVEIAVLAGACALLAAYGVLLALALARSRPWRRLRSIGSWFSHDETDGKLRAMVARLMHERRHQMMASMLPCVMAGNAVSLISMALAYRSEGRAASTPVLSIESPERTLPQDVLVIVNSCALIAMFALFRRATSPRLMVVSHAYILIALTMNSVLSPGDKVEVGLTDFVTAMFRMVINLVSMRHHATGLFSAFHLVAASLAYQRAEDTCEMMSARTFVFVELVLCVLIYALTWSWERFNMRWVEREIEADASQNEIAASRRLLNTICDAALELDEGLNIVDDASLLATMLQHGCNRSLAGTQVEQLVVEEERQHFREWIMAPPSAGQSMASVLHVSMRDSLCNVIDMEVFHVPIVGSLRGAVHLLGVREHADSVDHAPHYRRHGPAGRGSHGSKPAAAEERGPQPEILGSPTRAPGRPAAEGASQRSESSGRRSCTDSNSSSSRRSGRPVSTLPEPLRVRFDISTFTVLESSGPFSESCPPGSSFEELLPRGQDFFMDLQMGVARLRDVLPSDPRASFTFRSALALKCRGTTWKGLGEVTLSPQSAGADAVTDAVSECAAPVIASVRLTKGKFSRRRA